MNASLLGLPALEEPSIGPDLVVEAMAVSAGPTDAPGPAIETDPCPTLQFGYLLAGSLAVCAPRLQESLAIAGLEVPVGIALPLQASTINLATLGSTYRCKETALTYNDGSGSFGSKTCASTGHANTAWIYYCTSGTCTTDGSTHVTQYRCGCSDFNFDWEWYIEFTRGSPGYQGSSGTWPNTIVQHGVLIGQTVAQNLNNQIPKGHFETGVTLD